MSLDIIDALNDVGPSPYELSGTGLHAAAAISVEMDVLQGIRPAGPIRRAVRRDLFSPLSVEW